MILCTTVLCTSYHDSEGRGRKYKSNILPNFEIFWTEGQGQSKKWLLKDSSRIG